MSSQEEDKFSEGRKRAKALMASLRKGLEMCGEIRREQSSNPPTSETKPGSEVKP